MAIYSTDKPHMIPIIMAMLEINDIQAIEIDKQGSSYHIGESELFVRRKNVIKAKYLITKKSQ